MVSSSPPPSGVPCTAAMVGFFTSSSVAMTSIRLGGCDGLPNSVMSAPATKVRPAPVRMIASTPASSRAAMTCLHDALAHAMAQRIHGRIVDGDDGDVAVATQTDRIVQGRSLALFDFL